MSTGCLVSTFESGWTLKHSLKPGFLPVLLLYHSLRSCWPPFLFSIFVSSSVTEEAVFPRPIMVDGPWKYLNQVYWFAESAFLPPFHPPLSARRNYKAALGDTVRNHIRCVPVLLLSSEVLGCVCAGGKSNKRCSGSKLFSRFCTIRLLGRGHYRAYG